MKSFKFEITPETIVLDDVKTLHYEKYRGFFSGVYVFYDKHGDALYVGKTRDLSSRMRGHRKAKFYPYIYSILLYKCDNGLDLDVLETLVINELRPKHNKDKTYFKESDVTELIKDIEFEISSYSDDVQYLLSDIESLKKIDKDYYSLDGFSIDSEIDPIKEEIDRLNRLITELKEKKFRLSMRLS